MNTESVFRLITFLILASALIIGGYFRRKADREGGKLRSREGQGLVVILRLLGLIVVLPLFGYLINPDWVAWARFPVPDWLRWGAAAAAISLIPVFYWIFSSIGNNISATQATRQNHRLVTYGPYHYVRHPLYTAGFMCAIALALLTALWWLLVGMVLPLFILILRTSREEAWLIETFGDEYRNYMKRTGRFLPKVFGRRGA